MKYCGDCGAENEDRASYCQKCEKFKCFLNKEKFHFFSVNKMVASLYSVCYWINGNNQWVPSFF